MPTKTHFLYLLFAVLACPLSRAEFFVNAGPAVSTIKMFRRSAGVTGFSVGVGHSWAQWTAEIGYQNLGAATKNYYGQELNFYGDWVPDSRDRVSMQLEYALASWKTRPWRRIRADFGLGIAMAESRVTSKALSYYSKRPAFDYAYSNSIPLARAGVSIEAGRGVHIAIRCQAFQTRAAPSDDLNNAFGGGHMRIWSVTPELEYHF